MVEQNNKLLLKHHQSHSTSFVPSPKANATTLHRHRWGPGKACNHGQRCDLEQDRNNLWDKQQNKHIIKWQRFINQKINF